ncbi:hypothetical protein FOZ60_012481 [Perkinsus olseni]|uniref:Uncharacterized protein n=1 Tax=Perkinsus olseni TaxID=32597 RepID=A0A7J6NBD3_PEROL|nr:hypothetical protein FOZ60_012481 [Perkinsus olseni]
MPGEGSDSSNMVTAVNPATLGKTSLPTLSDKYDLPHHLEVVEACLVEAGYAKVDEATSNITILGKYRHLDVAASAKRAATLFGYDWPQIRRLLERQYCKKTSLKAEYQSKLKKLALKNDGECEAFIEGATEAFSLSRRAFGTDVAERRAFIRQLCRGIPHDTLLQLLRMIQTSMAAAGFSDTDNDWENAVAFDDFDLASRSDQDQPLVSTLTFCSALRSVCSLSEEAQRLTSAPTVAFKQSSDAVRLTQPTSERKPRPKFSDRYAHVMFITGSLLEDKGEGSALL